MVSEEHALHVGYEVIQCFIVTKFYMKKYSES